MPAGKTLDLNLLRTLEALFSCRQVSRAADRLGLTQPAVSQKLRQLREHFGDPLFVRAGAEMEPTPRAQALRGPLEKILAELGGVLADTGPFDPAGHERTFALCISDSTELSSFHSFMTRLRAAAPACRLRSLRAPVADIPDMLERGALDIAIGGLLSQMPSALRQVRLYSYDHVCLAAPGHPGLARGRLSRQQYRDLPQVVVTRSGGVDDALERLLQRHNVRRNAVVSLSNNLVAARMVTESDLVFTVPRPLAEYLSGILPLKVLELPFELPPIVSRLYWHERFHHDPANRWFREIARRHFQALSTPH